MDYLFQCRTRQVLSFLLQYIKSGVFRLDPL